MAVNPGYTRRQELRCTVADLATYSGVILYEGEVLYVKLANGKYAIKIGDGETNIANLPYVVNYSDISTQATNAAASASAASGSATAASGSAQTAEAYAKGTKNGTDVPSTDPAYHNNAKYYAEQAADNAEAAAEGVLNSKAEAVSLALAYDSTTAYKIGNLLTYQGKQYYCIKDATAGTLPTNTEYFEEKSVADIIEMIKNGSIVTGHSEVADNLTPYSEDSGTTQENPFISQGTGTDNNSVIVTTGTIARQLEKQGNTIPVSQLITRTTKEVRGVTCEYNSTINKWTLTGTCNESGAVYFFNGLNIPSHKLLIKQFGHDANIQFIFRDQTNSTNLRLSPADGDIGYAVITVPNTCTSLRCYILVQNGTTYNVQFELDTFDITGWKSDIITDLTANPSHFSWYYNGSLSYDAGSLKNCNGVKLVCTKGRNLVGGDYEAGSIDNNSGLPTPSSSQVRTANYKVVVPNTRLYITRFGTVATRYYFYDKDKNFIGSSTASGSLVTVPANACFYKDRSTGDYGGTYNNDHDVLVYYTAEQGGEGYDQHYDYEAPDVVDTGSETLLAFDKKTPDGVISRNGGNIPSLADLDWSYSTPYGTGQGFSADLPNATYHAKAYAGAVLPNIVCPKYLGVSASSQSTASATGIAIYNGWGFTDKVRIVIFDPAYTDVASFKTAMANVPLQYEYADDYKYTEQGTPFSQYANISDYGIMYWLDANDELVSIPQGTKLFYPVDYKGFLDDGVMYTNGDFTSLAKLEDIEDSALQARGYYKMQDLSSGITDNAGLTYTNKKVYKIGNVVFMTLTAKNETGSTIASGTTLFTVGSGLIPSADVRPSISLRVSNVNTETNLRIMNTSGVCLVNDEIADGCLIYIAISYAI